jgi:amino acid adenylation domain-containing protein
MRTTSASANRGVAPDVSSAAPAAPAATAGVDVFPTSFAQQRLWLLDRMAADRSVYNASKRLRMIGVLNVAALHHALNGVVARHEVLRTHIGVEQGVPVQVIAPELHLDLEICDLRPLPAAERVTEAERQVQISVNTPFELARGPLLRASLLRLSDDEHWFVLTLHHIVTDRRSSVVLGRELSALYNTYHANSPSPLPNLPLQYADYAVWQREYLQGDVLEQQLAYWKPVLAELPVQDLPADRARPAQADLRGGWLTFEIDATLTRQLRELGRREGATLFMTLLAAFTVLLHRYSGQDDVAVGVPTAGRTRPEFEQLIGFFVNTLVLRVDLRGAPTFAALLARVRRTALDAYAHQDLPFEKLVEEIAPKRDPSRNPLFQVLFTLVNRSLVEWSFAGIETSRTGFTDSPTAELDLSFRLSEIADGLRCEVNYATALFDAATIERMVDHYRTLLGSIVAEPGQRIERLPLQSVVERDRLLVAWNQTAMPYPETICVHRLVEAVAARTPGATAVVDGERLVTYGELNARANQLAHMLRQRAPGSAPRIGLCLERSAELIVAMLGVLKTGGAYVPLDPELPTERLVFMLHDADVSLLVTTTSLLSRLPVTGDRVLCLDRDAHVIAAQPTHNHDHAESPSQLAYIMYTSGSSGTPKGVLTAHRAIVRLTCGTDYIHIGATDALAHAANPAFDAATFEVWGALVNGARVVIVPRMVVLSPRTFVAMLGHAGITTLFLTTALFNQMARHAPDAFRGCRTVLFGGEAVEPRWVRAVLDAAPPARLLHVYGPTETTTFATWHEVRAVPADAITIPIGRPIANTEAYILDAEGEPVPLGLPGELHIGGPGLAAGYLNAPELTAQRFVRNPFSNDPNARIYRTGDRVRYRADGAIEFLGRLDRQVKIRGHRIELEEVEAAIARLPQVRDAVVVVRGETTDTRRLIAYVVAAASSGAPPANLWTDLKPLLPEYMLPASIVWLKSLPLDANGKIDRRALPAASEPDAAPAAVRVAPRDMFEQLLVGICERLLGVDGIGVFDHFFELGGHSLLAAQFLDEIERETGLTAPLAALFMEDTIAGLARLLREHPTDLDAPIVTINNNGNRPPLVFLHGDLHGGGFYSRSLAQALGPDQPVLVVKPHTLDDSPIPDTIEAMAADRLRALRALRPHGPYCFGGFCNGAFVAFEMARQLVAAGDDVPMVVAILARAPRGAPERADEEYVVLDRGGGYRRLAPHDSESDTQLRYVKAMDKYAGGPYKGRLVLLRSRERSEPPRDLGWSRFATTVEIHDLPGDHRTLVTSHIVELAQVIRDAMQSVFGRANP